MKFLDAIMNRVKPEEKMDEENKQTITFDVKGSPEFQAVVQELESQSDALAEAMCQIDELKSLLASVEAEKVQAQENAQKVKMDTRLANLSKDVGDERAAAVLAATEGLDDAQFEAIAQALKLSADNEAKSSLFTEAGVQGDVKADAHKGESAEMQIIKAKYKK